MSIDRREPVAESRPPRSRGPLAPAPRSRRAAPRRRAAITLTEVLISMGILTLGLLGVAALFPVGGYYMQKAENSDQGSAIAQSAMADMVARGMLDPRAWRVNAAPANPYMALRSDGTGITNTFRRRFSVALAEVLTTSSGNAPADRQRELARRFGHAFVIDPMAIAGTSITFSDPRNGVVSYFPASGSYQTLSGWSAHWQPWAVMGTWPVRRVTFPQPSTGAPMDPPTAEHYFRASDDLALDLPVQTDRPARQPWDLGAGQTPLARQWTGDYSWIATVVPTNNEARDGLAHNPSSHAYDVSVVVFFKRQVARVAPQSGEQIRSAYETLASNERCVKSKVISAGLNGGELLLETTADGISESPYTQLRAGQWIMLCGPHPGSSAADPQFVLKWYQVTAIDSELSDVVTNPQTQRAVTVRGPRWPWLPAYGGLNDAADLSNNLCVGIIPGAVAVHTKTMRLEGNSPWSFAHDVPGLLGRPSGAY